MDFKEETIIAGLQPSLQSLFKLPVQRQLTMMLNTADNFAAGPKLPPTARADTMQTLGEIGLWAKMADFEEEKFYTVLCAAMQNPEHAELFASVRCESAVPLAKVDQKLRPRDVNVETAKTGAAKKKAMTRPGGLDDFDLGNAPSTTLVETFELDPLVIAALSAKEESSCMSFFHKVSESESNRWLVLSPWRSSLASSWADEMADASLVVEPDMMESKMVPAVLSWVVPRVLSWVVLLASLVGVCGWSCLACLACRV